MLVFLAGAAVILSAIGLIVSPLWGVVIVIIVRPLVSTAWGQSFSGIAPLHVFGALLPVLLLPRLVFSRSQPRPPLWIQGVALLYLLSQTLGSYVLLAEWDLGSFLDVWLRALNGYLGFFLFAYYFRERRTFRILLLALLIAGVFPLLMGLYQNLTGVDWGVRQTVGLERKVGLYHDGVSLRAYGFQTIVAVILLRSYFRPSRRSIDLLLLLYVVAWAYVIFNLYSKAAVAIALLWWLTWPLLSRRYALLVGGILLGTVFLTPLGKAPLDSVWQLFSKEIDYGTGDLQDERRMFAGRGFIWDRFERRWREQPTEMKLIGTGRTQAVHNEFLRVLGMNGILGLSCLVLVCAVTIFALGNLVYRGRCTLCIVAVMVFEMYLVDCIGLTPGWYAHYHQFVWGIIGLALSAPWTVAGRDAAAIQGYLPHAGTSGAHPAPQVAYTRAQCAKGQCQQYYRDHRTCL